MAAKPRPKRPDADTWKRWPLTVTQHGASNVHINASANYTANQREGASPPLARS
jgi:hypothetical protein